MDGETEAGVEREVESFVLIPKRPRNFSDGRPVVALGTFGKNWARDGKNLRDLGKLSY